MIETLVLGLLGLAGLAAVLTPIVLADRAPTSDADPAVALTSEEASTDAALDAAVDRYRSALHDGMLCGRCLRPNPDGSRFCAECGRRLERTALRV